ncbi:LysR family transcriptional regulator [Cnuibacter physcomitrellae]|uniref:Uncharacterized protein n=1 Tax=Cnuibacter physcomitrellae TaxID=1619308 RepID=A0A1X9LR04_9MICO|nr:LysR family transcriptional regulator [Cnuibacter physcomitrellae]ARJ06872.1 hypothetical protein B5808_17815 [Cnuibacter physcomitrellae]GGI39028.1 LysR family transcriptional regulator [Cnuibacter physcomitrellae]
MDVQASVVAESAGDLVSLRLLAAVGESGSISAASRAVGMSQQAASARLRRLELGVGFPLLRRGARGTTLTSEGALAALWASDVVEAADRFEAGISGLRDDSAPLEVAASLTIAEYLIPAWLIALRRGDSRSILLSVAAMNSSRVIERVRTRERVLGFIESPQDTAGLASRLVARDELVVVVAPEHPWSARESISAAQLARTPLIVREQGSGTRLSAEQMMADAGLTPAAPYVELPTTSAIRTSVAAGDGAAILSILAVRDDLAAGRLMRVRVRDLRFVRELRAVYTDEQLLPSRLQTLLALATRLPLGSAPIR